MSRIDCIVHFARRKTLQIGSYLHPLLMYQAKLPSGNLDGENSQNIFPGSAVLLCGMGLIGRYYTQVNLYLATVLLQSKL